MQGLDGSWVLAVGRDGRQLKYQQQSAPNVGAAILLRWPSKPSRESIVGPGEPATESSKEFAEGLCFFLQTGHRAHVLLLSKSKKLTGTSWYSLSVWTLEGSAEFAVQLFSHF